MVVLVDQEWEFGRLLAPKTMFHDHDPAGAEPFVQHRVTCWGGVV